MLLELLRSQELSKCFRIVFEKYSQQLRDTFYTTVVRVNLQLDIGTKLVLSVKMQFLSVFQPNLGNRLKSIIICLHKIANVKPQKIALKQQEIFL